MGWDGMGYSCLGLVCLTEVLVKQVSARPGFFGDVCVERVVGLVRLMWAVQAFPWLAQPQQKRVTATSRGRRRPSAFG